MIQDELIELSVSLLTDHVEGYGAQGATAQSTLTLCSSLALHCKD